MLVSMKEFKIFINCQFAKFSDGKHKQCNRIVMYPDSTLWRGERGKAECVRGRAGSETSGETIGK